MSDLLDIAKLREALAKAAPGEWVPPLVLDSLHLGWIYNDAGTTIAASVTGRNAHLITLMHTALPSLLDALEAQSWRPIETAPKDGTEILAFGPYGDRPQTVAFRNAEWRCSHGSRVIESEGDFGIKYKRADPLSHWMPLPEGPKP